MTSLSPHLSTGTAMLRRQRQLREHYFDAALFGEPAWDILLALAEAGAPQQITTAIGGAAAPTTALRYLGLLESQGLVEPGPAATDRRRRLIQLTPAAAQAMAAYLYRIG